MFQLHIVAGPTASGKSDFARNLAGEVDGELINADSRQIYRYLDIGTNKDTSPPAPLLDQGEGGRRSGEVIHLISFLEPDQRFSLYEYAERVAELLPQIWEAGKTPILVGGTGLYINIVLNPEMYIRPKSELLDIDLDAFASAAKRSLGDWEQGQVTEDRTTLQRVLQEFAPTALAHMNESDRQNPRRLIALINRLMSPAAGSSAESLLKVMQTYQPEIVKHYIDLPDDLLVQRINSRVEKMFEAGLVEEVVGVLARGYPASSVGLQGVGYREVLDYLDHKIDLIICKRLIQEGHRQYAKRQRTWFKKYFTFA